MPAVLRSKATNIFLAKLWGPLSCFLIAIGLSDQGIFTWSFLLACPFLFAGLFGATVATVEVRNGGLRYRRLFQWRTIRNEEIAEAGVAWGPVLGSIRLNRYLFPWGRLYFALDANLKLNPFREGEYSLLNQIRHAMEEPSFEQVLQKERSPARR